MRKLVRQAIVGTTVGVLVAGAVAVPQLVDAVGRDGQAAGPAGVQDLKKDLDAILNEPGSKDAIASVLVRDAATGKDLYNHDGGERLLPASNTKLFTEAAALQTLGEGHRFHTDVLTRGSAGGTVQELYLRGGGDPTMLAKDYDALAKQVAQSGVRSVRGDLIADDTRYDDVRLGNSWAWDDESQYYSGQVSALTLAPDEDYDAGTVIVEVTPGTSAGDKPKVSMVPSNDHVRIDNQATTTAAGESTLSVDREHGANKVTIEGSVPADADPEQSYVAVWDPTTYAAGVFRDALERHGVEVEGQTSTGATPDAADRVAVHASMTLAKMSVPFMKLSNNGHAEVLMKEMGYAESGDGSWDAGIEARDEALTELNVDPSTFNLDDGSGLSRRDYAPPRQITNVLLSARKQPWAKTWKNALPVAGDPDRLVGGTLTDRLRDTPAEGNVTAKTGSLTGVSGLSGYVTDADGNRLVFSILHNNHLDLDAKDVEDRIAVRLAKFSREGSSGVVETGPSSVPHPYRGPSDVECSWTKSC